MKEGEADRGIARSEGGSEGGILLRRAGRREMKEGAGRGSAWIEVESEEGREGREGEK